MTTQKHTPGPWIQFVDGDPMSKPIPDEEALKQAKEEAEIHGGDCDVRFVPVAQAYAAPELLEACKLMFKDADYADHILDKIEAAIAKAEGRG